MCVSYGISLCLCEIRISLFLMFEFTKLPDNSISYYILYNCARHRQCIRNQNSSLWFHEIYILCTGLFCNNIIKTSLSKNHRSYLFIFKQTFENLLLKTIFLFSRSPKNEEWLRQEQQQMVMIANSLLLLPPFGTANQVPTHAFTIWHCVEKGWKWWIFFRGHP